MRAVNKVLVPAETGDRLGTLQMLRNRLAAEVDRCDDQRLLPALVLRLTDVLVQIDEMPQTQKVSRADEIAQRRAARRGAGTADTARPAKNTS
jgi:hypothetical protein